MASVPESVLLWLAPGLLVGVLLLAAWVWRLRRALAARARCRLPGDTGLRELLDASPDAMWVNQRDGLVVECNRRLAELAKVECCSLIGRPLGQVFGAVDPNELRRMHERLFATGERQTVNVSLPNAAGAPIELEVSKVPLRGKDGRVTAVLSVARDVTERRRDYERLQLWAHAFQQAAFGIAIFDVRTYRILAANPSFARLRGYTPEEMEGLSVNALYPPETVAERARAREALDRLAHWEADVEHVDRHGGRFPVHLDVSVYHDDAGAPMYALVQAHDISARRRAEQELEIAAVAFEAMDALLITDAERTIQRVNRAFTRLSGYTAEELVGRSSNLLRSDHHNDAFYTEMWKQVRRDGYWNGQRWIAVKNGAPRVVRMAITAVHDAAGAITHHVYSIVDLSQEREAKAHIERLTFYDQLTSLPNRALLWGRLKDRPSRAGVRALLMADIDHLRLVNDMRDHAVGDRLIAQVAQRLRTALDEDCLLARLGGGTFGILLAGEGERREWLAASVQAAVDRIRQAMHEPFLVGDATPVSATVSVGWTELAAGREAPEVVLKEAELAMYSAKAGGPGRVCRFESSMQQALQEREQLLQELGAAIVNEALELHAQGQFDTEGRLLGAEMLVRWQRPGAGMVSPGVFIPLAEAHGLILPLGDWVLRRACAQLKTWETHAQLREVVLAVNVSPKQLAQPDFVQDVRAALADSGANPAYLKLEITESAIVDDVDGAAAKLAQLRELGISISLDDFGTGYSSLSHLARLPLDQVKIDQSFVRQLGQGGNHALVVRTIIAMGDGLGLDVIAEGVETADQLAFLVAHGCARFQGYLFAKPMAVPAFESTLGQRLAKLPARFGDRNGL